MRHSFATGLMEAGVDLLTLSRLLGHSSFSSTLIYLHVRRPQLESTPSPFDWLTVAQCPTYVDPKRLPCHVYLQRHHKPHSTYPPTA